MASLTARFIIQFVIVISIITTATCTNCNGCVQLDSISFDKVVSKFQAALVKFDVAYPYGDKHDEFCKASTALASNADVLVADVGIKDYGEGENTDLARRFTVTQADYPTVLLFLRDQLKPLRFQGEFTSEALQRFVSRSGVRLELSGRLYAFDELATEFMASVGANASERRHEILGRTNDALSTLPNGSQNHRSAQVYVKVMNKLLDKGFEFLSLEIRRVESLIKDGQVTTDQKTEMQRRLNILQAFLQSEGPAEPLKNAEL